jgi:hypothetical protein
MEPEQTYGKRLHRAAREDFRKFWSGHRVWVTVATLISPFLMQWKNHGWGSLLTAQDTLESGGLALGLSIVGNYLIALWGGASSLDAGLQETIVDKEAELAQHKDKISTLETAQARKNPYDEHLDRTIREALAKLDLKQQEFVRHLLDAHRMNNADVHNAGFPTIPNLVIGKTGQTLIHFDSHRPGNGLIEMDRFYYINPGNREAIRNVLHSRTIQISSREA